MLNVIDLSYKVSLNEVDKYLQEHRDYLQKFYDEGYFIASGSKDPRTGGVILAIGEEDLLNDIIKGDPFYTNGIADYSIVRFNPVKKAPGFAALMKQLCDNNLKL